MAVVQVKGISTVLNDFKRFEQLFESNKGKVLSYAAIPLIQAIKQRAPVGKGIHKRYQKGLSRAKRGSGVVASTINPGNLRGSFMLLKKLKKNGAVYVGPYYGRAKVVGKSRFDGYYAGMVNFGTKNQKAKNFVAPAISASEAQVVYRIQIGYTQVVNKFK